tara:strand:+ start:64984 stop:65625 length:642 start_codon:yes stop_codon:yes gene_type:complete
MADKLLQFDDWGSQCPICKLIVEEENWPRLLDCGELDDPAVQRGEKHPPCMVCGSLEIEEEFFTVVTKNMNAMSHTRVTRCRSCGTGRVYEGIDAVTGKPKLVYKYPPELDQKELVAQIQRHLEQGEENEELLQKSKFAIACDAFFRPHQFYCLDTGWEVLGYGVRPLERTEIMTRFYEWTNREAMAEADESTNPLRKKTDSKKKKKKKWWKG